MYDIDRNQRELGDTGVDMFTLHGFGSLDGGGLAQNFSFGAQSKETKIIMFAVLAIAAWLFFFSGKK